MRCQRCRKECERKSSSQKYCPDCRDVVRLESARERARQRRLEFPEKVKQEDRRKYIKNRDRIRARTAKWYREHLDQARKNRKEWKQRNIDKVRELDRKRRETNKDCFNARNRRWHTKNRDRINDLKRKTRAENPDGFRAQAREWANRRRARKLNAEGSHTFDDFLFICEEMDWRCAYCGKKCTLGTITEDHVIPLSRGGSDDISNITPACRTCNLSKGAKMPEEFLTRCHNRGDVI